LKPDQRQVVIYWDASAILSALIKDQHSGDAQFWAVQDGVHLLSSLSYSEVLAVLFRIRRERKMTSGLIRTALGTLESGPWRPFHIAPEWSVMKKLSNRWSLRGADLWHLAAAKTFQTLIAETLLLTYDTRLKVAAQGEEIAIS
jgi:predicted nucleic acid-binding protein